METIKELISQVTLFVRTLHAMASELEEQSKRIKTLEENRKLKDAEIARLRQELAMLKMTLRRKDEVHVD